jgi:hypothetical protein
MSSKKVSACMRSPSQLADPPARSLGAPRIAQVNSHQLDVIDYLQEESRVLEQPTSNVDGSPEKRTRSVGKY